MNLLSKWAYFLLLSLVCVHFSKGETATNLDEWILTRSSSKNPWNLILSQIKDYELMSSFGPNDRYALVRKKAATKSKLPREIVSIQRNYPYKALEKVDPDFNKSWGLQNTGQLVSELGTGTQGIDVAATQAWEIGTGNKNQVVAILDSGIDLKHEDLKNNLWVNKLELEVNAMDDDHNGFINDLNGWNFVDNNSNIQDDNNHGSAVAGVIAADTKNGVGSRGLLENASVMAIKILDKNGMGSTERAVRAIQYAVNNGASVINASWGGTLFDQALFDTISWANDKGVLFVCAAGNDPKDNDTDDKPTFPASFRLPNVVSVAAHDPKGELTAFSSFGKQSVHIAAPGIAIYTTIIGGYKSMDGTSFATPFVAAASLLLKSLEPKLSANQIKNRLINTAVPMDYYTQAKLASGGRLNVYSLLKNIVTPAIPTPTDWKRKSWVVESQHPYLNNTNQVFETSVVGAKHIRAHFNKLDLEKSYDQVVVKDKTGKVAGFYTGKAEDFWSADVLGDTLKMEFLSDFSNSQWGFSIDAIEYAE